MNRKTILHSPSFKNVKIKASLSPKDLKEKMRKDYKSKIQNCRDTLLNRIRNSVKENDIRKTFTDIYNSTFNISDAILIREHWDEEDKLLEEIKQDLIQEEIEWWLQEYEKSQLNDIDWSTFDQEQNVICPICQKNNLSIESSYLTCQCCNLNIKTTHSLGHIQRIIFECIEKHSNACNSNVNFVVVPDTKDNHIFLACENCNDMQLIL